MDMYSDSPIFTQEITVIPTLFAPQVLDQTRKFKSILYESVGTCLLLFHVLMNLRGVQRM